LVTHFRYAQQFESPAPGQSGHDGPIDVQLTHSRNGRTWHRCADRSPVIPNGPYAYDAGCILGTANTPVFVDDEMWIYYTAITTTHGGPLPEKRITIARAAWRLDGLVSLSAGNKPGVAETVPLHFSGDRLSVNANAKNGSLAVRVLNERGKSLPGYSLADCIPLRADAVRHAVRWKDHSHIPTDHPVRLCFHLENARLFSYTVGHGERRKNQ
jgi:hypothetical protein